MMMILVGVIAVLALGLSGYTAYKQKKAVYAKRKGERIELYDSKGSISEKLGL